MLRVGGVMVLWLAAVACEGWDWEDQAGSGSWGPAPGPAPEPWYHCGAENGSALCLPGRVPNGGEGRSHHSEDCDSQCSMYKCSGLGSDLQCIPDPFGTYATRTDCETGCHLYRCDGVQCIQDDLHGTYFKEVRPTASPPLLSMPLAAAGSRWCAALEEPDTLTALRRTARTSAITTNANLARTIPDSASKTTKAADSRTIPAAVHAVPHLRLPKATGSPAARAVAVGLTSHSCRTLHSTPMTLPVIRKGPRGPATSMRSACAAPSRRTSSHLHAKRWRQVRAPRTSRF